jgi:hypothetical protein
VNDVLKWLDEHSGQLQSVGVLLAVGAIAWAMVKGVPRFIRRCASWLLSQLRRVPFRLVRVSPPIADPPYAVVVDEPASPLVPLTLRERCEKLAAEMELQIAERDKLPEAIQARYGDYRYFLPRLRELRQEVVYDGHGPTEPLNMANILTELSRRDALRMVRALRHINWANS